MPLRALWLLAGGTTPVTLNPDPSKLPGIKTIQALANGIGGWALIAAVIGMVVGAILWAFGRRTTTMKSLVIGLTELASDGSAFGGQRVAPVAHEHAS